MASLKGAAHRLRRPPPAALDIELPRPRQALRAVTGTAPATRGGADRPHVRSGQHLAQQRPDVRDSPTCSDIATPSASFGLVRWTERQLRWSCCSINLDPVSRKFVE